MANIYHIFLSTFFGAYKFRFFFFFYEYDRAKLKLKFQLNEKISSVVGLSVICKLVCLHILSDGFRSDNMDMDQENKCDKTVMISGQ